MATAVVSTIMSENEISSASVQPFTVQSWTQTVIRPTLIILMVAALMGAILSVGISIDPSRLWRVGYIICFLVIIESYFTTTWLQNPARRNLDHLKYRAAELLVTVVIIRLLTWWIQGNWPESNAFLVYLKNPFDLFYDGYFWAILGLSIIAWQRTIAISRSFSLMKPDEAELAYYTLPRNERDPNSQPISDDRSQLHNSFAQQFLGGGLVVLLCAGLATYNLSDLGTVVADPLTGGLTRLGLSPSMLASLLLYFLCGFLLLSQGRLAILEMRWLAGDIQQKTPIGRHWHRRTLFVLLAIGLIAAFLPVGSTLPFMQILNLVLYAIISMITAVVYLISLLLFFILSVFFRREETGEDSPPPPPPPIPEQAPINVIETSETFQYILSSAFWALAIIGIIIAFAFFIQNRGIRVENTILKRLWLTLRLWWHQLRQGFNEQMQDIQGGIQAFFEQTSKEKTERALPWRFIRVNALPPREKIYYFYLSIIRRANQRGVVREENETPLEFADDLKTNWPEAEIEIDELTKAFLHARYSPSAIDESDVSPAKKQWQQIKANLRKRKKHE